jgi:nicotinamidase-related amidase
MNYSELLSPQNSAVIFIDFQPQMTFGVANIDRQTLSNNVLLLAKAAKIFKALEILTTVGSKCFSGFMGPQLLDLCPGQAPIERSSMNSWGAPKFVETVMAWGRKKLIIATLWTEVWLAFPALESIGAGYKLCAVEDGSGVISVTVHNAAMRRIEKAGAISMTALQVLLVYQQNWARKKTYDAVTEVVKKHCGAFGPRGGIRLHLGARRSTQPEGAWEMTPWKTRSRKTGP